MGTVKDIYDLAKDGIKLQRHITAIKRALKTEAVLNRKFLKDIEQGKEIDDTRRKRIIGNLAIVELTDAVKLEIPYALITNKLVDAQLMGDPSINRTLGYSLGTLIEKLYLMIAYIQKDLDDESNNLNSRLQFISKYNTLLLRMLE